MSTGKFTSPINSADSNVQSGATPIVRDTNWTIVLVNIPSGQSNPSVSLPDNADVGDLVEIHVFPISGTLLVFPEAGGQINQGGTNDGVPGGRNSLWRRISAGNWQTVVVST